MNFISNLNIALLNVCGLKAKLKGPDFEEFAHKFDIVCLTETKLDELDCVNLPDYRLLRKDRKKKRRASGGVAILVKENIAHRIQILNTEVDDTLWFTVTNIGLEKDVLFGLVYIPPRTSLMLIPMRLDKWKM